jgi:hypothetical protein
MMRVYWAFLCVLALSGCDPIKRAMRRQQRLDAAVSEYLRRNPPRVDTMYLPGDTIYHTDTIVNENIYVDTVRLNDTVYITKVNWREYLTTAYVRDTIIRKVSDCAEYSHLRDQNIVLQDRYESERKRSKSYMWAVFALAAIIVGAITFKIVRSM